MNENTGFRSVGPQEDHVAYRLSDVSEYDSRSVEYAETEYVGGIPLYPVGATVYLYGPPGIGKSLVQQMIQHTIAWGKPIGHGETMFVPDHLGNVLYLDFEGSDKLMAERSKAITPEMTERPICDIYWHTPTREADGETWAPTLPERLAQVEDMLVRHEEDGTPISMVVVDTFTAFVGGNDSRVNAYDHDVTVIKPFNALAARHEVCVVFIHHPNKAGEMSGSTGRAGSAWIVASLKPTVRDQSGRVTEIELRMEKNRLGIERTFAFSREFTKTWTFITDIPAMACQFKGNTRKIWDLLMAHGPGTKAQIIETTGFTDASVKAALSRLQVKGMAHLSEGNVWTGIGQVNAQLEKKRAHQKGPVPPPAPAAPFIPGQRRGQLPATVLKLDLSKMDPEDPKHKGAIPASMDLMWAAVKDENRRQHPSMFTEMPKEVTDIWEGRNRFCAVGEILKGTIQQAIEQYVEPGTGLVTLDKNAAFLGATNTRLPRGPLEFDQDPNEAYAKGRAGFHLVEVNRKQFKLVGPFHQRNEDGRVWIPTPIVKELMKFGPVEIFGSWTSTGSEALLQKWRETLRDLRKHAMDTKDDVLKGFVKSCYSKTISTMGSSTANFEIDRREWGPIIRSQAYVNLRNDARKLKEAGVTVVGVGGTDEIVIVFDEKAVKRAKESGALAIGSQLGAYKVKRTWFAGEESA